MPKLRHGHGFSKWESSRSLYRLGHLELGSTNNLLGFQQFDLYPKADDPDFWQFALLLNSSYPDPNVVNSAKSSERAQSECPRGARFHDMVPRCRSKTPPMFPQYGLKLQTNNSPGSNVCPPRSVEIR